MASCRINKRPKEKLSKTKAIKLDIFFKKRKKHVMLARKRLGIEKYFFK